MATEPIDYTDAIDHLAAQFVLNVKAMNALRTAIRRAGQDVVESWRFYINEYGGVMCGEDDCLCDMEGQIILTPYEEGRDEWPRWTQAELYQAIELHIADMSARREEAEEDERLRADGQAD
jgi:hypothetical protein